MHTYILIILQIDQSYIDIHIMMGYQDCEQIFDGIYISLIYAK